MTDQWRELAEYLVNHAVCNNMPRAGEALAIVSSPKRWSERRRAVCARIWAVAKSHGYKGKRIAKSIIEWLRSIDLATVIAIARIILPVILTFLKKGGKANVRKALLALLVVFL